MNVPTPPPQTPKSVVDYSKNFNSGGGSSVEQIEALLAIGVALKSASWKENGGWESGTSLSDLFGIGVETSNDVPLVRLIRLAQNNLSGSLYECPLNMFANSLKFIDVSNNPEITGELSSFGCCPLLEVLTCHRCSGMKGGLEMLVACTRLQVLNLEGTSVKGVLSPLSLFGANLRLLNVRETELDATNLRKLETLVKLEQLSLGSTAHPLGYHRRTTTQANRGPSDEFDDEFLSLWFRPLSCLKSLHILDLHSPLPARRHTTSALGRELTQLSNLRAVYLRSKHVDTGRRVTLDPAGLSSETSPASKDPKDGLEIFSSHGTANGGAAMASLFSQSSKLSKQEQVLKEEQAVLDRCIARLRSTAALKPECVVYWTKVW